MAEFWLYKNILVRTEADLTKIGKFNRFGPIDSKFGLKFVS
jgi:hypothetical protein